VIERNAYLYHQEYGWDSSYQDLVARIVADYLDTRDPNRENAWIAERAAPESAASSACGRTTRRPG
jgi:hypothetical protein